MVKWNIVFACVAALATLSVTSTEADLILQYDSNGNAASSTLDVFGTPDAAFVTTASTVSLGSNTFSGGTFTDTSSTNRTIGTGNTQQNVTNASNTGGGDRFFMFGGYNELLSGTLADAVTGGEWVGASFTAAQALVLDQFDYQLFVNNSTQHSARDSGLFVSVGGGAFTQFGSANDQSANGDRGVVSFTDSLSVAAGQTVDWRLAFTDRTRVANNLPNTRTTRIGDIQITASAVPEPSGLILAALGFVSVIGRRRRRCA